MTIHQRLRQTRQARGLSLEALAVEMSGMVTKQALSKYEQFLVMVFRVSGNLPWRSRSL